MILGIVCFAGLSVGIDNIKYDDDTTMYSGTMDDDTSWSLDYSGTLTIWADGSGMSDLTDMDQQPWGPCRNSIISICILPGVTNIGDYAFTGCIMANYVEIPDSVTRIGKSAFLGCASLGNINMQNSVTTIDHNGLFSCENLSSLYFSYALDSGGVLTSEIINTTLYTTDGTDTYNGKSYDELCGKLFVKKEGSDGLYEQSS